MHLNGLSFLFCPAGIIYNYDAVNGTVYRRKLTNNSNGDTIVINILKVVFYYE